jgi:hypothetical protein
MGWMILEGKLMTSTRSTLQPVAAVFVDTTTDQPFGPVMRDAREAEALSRFIGRDPRGLSRTTLERQLLKFRDLGSPMVNALDTANTWRRIKPRLFPSGPGFDVLIGDLRIGSFGRHTHETAWWWQLDSKLDTKRVRLKAGRRAGRMVGTTAGMKSTKPVALAALMAAWKSLHDPKSPGAAYQARQPHVRTRRAPKRSPERKRAA